MTESLRYSPMPPPKGDLFLSAHERWQIKNEKKEASTHITAKVICAMGLTATILVGGAYKAFQFDQTVLAQMAWGNDKASVSTIWEHNEHYGTFYPPTAEETYIYVIPGTGIRDAAPTIAKPISAAFESIPNAKYMALREGSHPQVEDTYQAVDSTINKMSPPGRIIIYGMSAGGKEALKVASHFRETLPKTDQTVILSSTPYDQDSAYQLRGTNNNLPFIADLSARLKLYGGPTLRFLIEMYNREYQCQDEKDNFSVAECIGLAHRVYEEKLTRNTTSNELFQWQVAWTMANTAGGDISSLKNVTNGPRTALMYINTTQDTIVDEGEAIPKFEADAAKANIPFTIMKLVGPHANEHDNPKPYITNIIKPYLARVDGIYSNITAKQQLEEQLAAQQAAQAANYDETNLHHIPGSGSAYTTSNK